MVRHPRSALPSGISKVCAQYNLHPEAQQPSALLSVGETYKRGRGKWQARVATSGIAASIAPHMQGPAHNVPDLVNRRILEQKGCIVGYIGQIPDTVLAFGIFTNASSALRRQVDDGQRRQYHVFDQLGMTPKRRHEPGSLQALRHQRALAAVAHTALRSLPDTAGILAVTYENDTRSPDMFSRFGMQPVSGADLSTAPDMSQATGLMYATAETIRQRIDNDHLNAFLQHSGTAPYNIPKI